MARREIRLDKAVLELDEFSAETPK